MQSGDAGYLNPGKQLVVIDRIKDLAETARGERFSPQYIENKLKFSPYIAETVVLGAGRDALAAMICIRYSIISKWAEKKRISFTTYTDLASRPEVFALARRRKSETERHPPSPAKPHLRFLLLYKERRRRRASRCTGSRRRAAATERRRVRIHADRRRRRAAPRQDRYALEDAPPSDPQDLCGGRPRRDAAGWARPADEERSSSLKSSTRRPRPDHLRKSISSKNGSRASAWQ